MKEKNSMSDKLQRNDNRTPTQAIIDKEAATDGWLQRRQVKIYLKQEQPVLRTTFQKGVEGREQKPSFQMPATTSGRQKKSFFKPEIFFWPIILQSPLTELRVEKHLTWKNNKEDLLVNSS